MKEDIKKFNEYAKNYDLKEKPIMGKFHHSFRVMELCEEIAKQEKLNEEEIYIARLCGLYHDIARFEQWTKYQTFLDQKSFNHGDEGYKILLENNFIKDKRIKQIVLEATKYHNKYEVDKSLDDKTLLFCKIVRDADKLDIMKEQCNSIKDEIKLKKELLNNIYNKQIVNNLDVTNSTDNILRQLSWIFDLNFKYSYHFLKINNIIDNKFNLLELYGSNEEINKLKKFIYNELEKRN